MSLGCRGFVASTNGCGTTQLPFQEAGDKHGLTPCCDQHDRCYGTCGKTFQECEEEFSSCLGPACDGKFRDRSSPEYEQCRQAAAMFSMGTRLAGCTAFEATQRDACDCSDHGGPAGMARKRPAARRQRSKHRLPQERLQPGVSHGDEL